MPNLRYLNEPCCGCEALLRPETDDVVVCPDCGAPMHRHCWQAESRCPLAARHGGGFAWVPTIEPEDPPAPAFDPREQPGVICLECGENCPPGSLHCENCGTDFGEATRSILLRAQRKEQETLRREQQFRENFPTYLVHGRRVRIGDTVAGQPMEEITLQLRGSPRSVTRYLERFENGTRTGWNWAAFVFGVYWYFFRKLYKPALLFAGVLLAVTLAFAPVNSAAMERLSPRMDQFQQAERESLEAAMNGFYAELKACLRDYRWQLLGIGALWLGAHVAAGLFADDLLRRKIIANIARAREDFTRADTAGGEVDQAVSGGAAETATQRLGRQQLLIRLGGISFFAPVLYFWVGQFLPGLILDFIRTLTG